MPDVIHTYMPITAGTRKHCPAGLSLAEYVQQSGADAGPVVCALGGVPVLRADWPGLILRDDDLLVVICLPQGGSGGGSDPARIVATLAVMALAMAAPGMAPAAWGLLYAGGGATFAGALLSAGIMMGGTMLINAVMPVAEAATPGASNSPSGSTSTTYSLNSPTNMSKIGSVIPVQYGRMETTPPLIAAPWSEYSDNQEFVHILLCLGQGYYDVESLRFDTVDFTAVPDVEYQIVEPGDVVPYEDNIFTSPHVSGSEIQRLNSYETPTAYHIVILSWANGLDTVKATIDDGLGFVVGDVVLFDGATNRTGTYKIVNIEVHMGGGYAYLWIKNPDHPQPYDDFTGKIMQAYSIRYTEFWPQKYSDYEWWEGAAYTCTFWVDIVFSSGLYTVETDGSISQAVVELQIYKKAVQPDGSYGSAEQITEAGEAGTITISGAQQTPMRVSFEVSFDSLGTEDWAIGIGRLAGPVKSTTANLAYWTGLRFKYPKQGTYADITTIAVRAKASEGLSPDALSKIRVLSTRMLPTATYDLTYWTAPVKTRSIVWAAADVCRNAGYSIGLDDSKVDFSALLYWAATWIYRGDHCDGVFDTKTTFWSALKTVLKTGRAQPHMVGDKITFTRDYNQTAVRAVFGPRNIVRGSFRIEYLHYDPDTPDDVDLEYFSSDTWEWETVRCALPGSSGDAPASVRMWGITDAAQAQREGLYMAACNRYRRTFVTFQTEMDARIVLRGQQVSVSHPLPSWGFSGEIVGISGSVLTLSEPVEYGVGAHYIAFRKNDGSQDGPYQVLPYGPDEVLLDDPLLMGPPSYVTADINLGRTQFQFGLGDNFERRCLVISATPRSGNKVELLCVVENDAVHTADAGA